MSYPSPTRLFFPPPRSQSQSQSHMQPTLSPASPTFGSVHATRPDPRPYGSASSYYQAQAHAQAQAHIHPHDHLHLDLRSGSNSPPDSGLASSSQSGFLSRLKHHRNGGLHGLGQHDSGNNINSNGNNQNHNETKRKSRGRSRGRHSRTTRRFVPSWTRIRSVLYHGSFYFFLLLVATLLVGSAWGLGEQSWRTGDRRSWNIVVLAAAYVVLGLISITHVWSRILSIKKILRTMPKPYIPTKTVDLPKKVAHHIAIEYSRTAVVAHISQATTGQQEGWGRPGTKWEDKHFRTYILSTLPIMRQALCPFPSSLHPPHSLVPLYEAVSPSDGALVDKGALRLFVNSYGKIIDRARYGRAEPTQEDAEAVEKVVEVVLLTLEVKRRREMSRPRAKSIARPDTNSNDNEKGSRATTGLGINDQTGSGSDAHEHEHEHDEDGDNGPT